MALTISLFGLFVVSTIVAVILAILATQREDKKLYVPMIVSVALSNVGFWGGWIALIIWIVQRTV